jgi:hypothetical protein
MTPDAGRKKETQPQEVNGLSITALSNTPN